MLLVKKTRRDLHLFFLMLKKLKMEHDKKKEKRQMKVDEDEIQKMQ